MLDVQALQAHDLQGLSSSALAEVARQMLAHIGTQSLHIERQGRDIKLTRPVPVTLPATR